jgi:hypothetical protein
MPFAVFRRHQRKLLAVFAILAMFGFVVADSLPRLLNGNISSGGDTTVVEIFGRKVRRSELNAMAGERNNANLFIAELTSMGGRPVQQRFGDLTTRSLVDALILKHEADRLGMPAGPEVASKWLRQRGALTSELFELILRRFNNKVSGEQLLSDIADQIRIENVRGLVGGPTVTPLDVFNTYREQTERVSARAVVFQVEKYVPQVAGPSASEVKAYYEMYKDVLPDPARPTPGFKIPRQIQAEILSIDGDALARSYKDKLTEEELKSYYENRKTDFKKPNAFPDEIFLGQPELTPPQYQPFGDVRSYLATSLADERAQKEITDKFSRIKDDVLIPFADKYLTANDEIEEAKKSGAKPTVALPVPESLKALAKKEELGYESPTLTHDQAEHYGMVSGAEVGLTRGSNGRRFAEELFDAKTTLYEPVELTDFTGHRYLVRKLQDIPPRVPDLADIKPEVILAWKTEKARPLAEKDAKAHAESIKAAGGKVQGDILDGHPVINIESVTMLQPGLPIPGSFFETGPPSPSEIPNIPNPTPELREAFFSLKEGAPAVATNLPETAYYVLTLSRRSPAEFAVLFAPNGDYMRYRTEAMSSAIRKRLETWMADLRAKAGLPKDWVPTDEAAKNADKSAKG